MKPALLLNVGNIVALGVGMAGCVSEPQTAPTARGGASSQEYLVPMGAVPLRGVEGRLDHLAADPQSGRLFVAALENHTVEVLDLFRLKRLHSIPGLSEPQGLLVVGESRLLLVCSRGDGTCRSFDADTFEEGPWVDLGRNADNVRYDRPRHTAYVGSGAEPGPGLLSAIDLAALLPAQRGGIPAAPRSRADLLLDRPRQADVQAEITLAAHPESFQLDAANHRIFVNIPDEHHVAVIDVQTNGMTVTAKWPVTAAEKNFPMALDAGCSRLFVVCRKPACVLAYDTQTGKMLSSTPCVGDSDDAFFDTATRRLYVIGGEGFVDAFGWDDKADRLVLLTRGPTAPKARTGLFIPALRTLAVVVPHTANEAAAVRLYRVAP